MEWSISYTRNWFLSSFSCFMATQISLAISLISFHLISPAIIFLVMVSLYHDTAFAFHWLVAQLFCHRIVLAGLPLILSILHHSIFWLLAVNFTLYTCRLSRNSKHSCWYFWTFSVALLVSVGVSTLLEIILFTLKFMFWLATYEVYKLYKLLKSLALDTNSYVNEIWVLSKSASRSQSKYWPKALLK